MVDRRALPINPGDIIDRKYRVEGRLGDGGMGIVVAARHVTLDELRAIKLMKPSEHGKPQAVERFTDEARAAVKLASEHTAKIYDFGFLESGMPYIVMEYLEGNDLAKLLKARGPLPIHTAALYVTQVCDAIAEAHARRIVHRDLKPANLFLTTRLNGTPCVKVLDFGLSKVRSRVRAGRGDRTRPGEVMGTPYYMSPEQMRSTRDATSKTDIWSLGVILYELVTGQRPFTGETAPLIHAAVLSRDPVPPSSLRPELPAPLDALILRCLEKEADKRLGSVQDLKNGLAPYAGGEAARRSDTPPRSSDKPPRSSDKPPRPSAPAQAPRPSDRPVAPGIEALPEPPPLPTFGSKDNTSR